jgi:hypothetical protein
MIDDRRRRGMTTAKTDVTREQLLRVQARAERAGLTGDALREVLAMICQPVRETYWSGNNRKVAT